MIYSLIFAFSVHAVILVTLINFILYRPIKHPWIMLTIVDIAILVRRFLEMLGAIHPVLKALEQVYLPMIISVAFLSAILSFDRYALTDRQPSVRRRDQVRRKEIA